MPRTNSTLALALRRVRLSRISLLQSLALFVLRRVLRVCCVCATSVLRVCYMWSGPDNISFVFASSLWKSFVVGPALLTVWKLIVCMLTHAGLAPWPLATPALLAARREPALCPETSRGGIFSN